MTNLVDPAEVERIVGARRHPRDHVGRLDLDTDVVTILHSQECIDERPDLRDCPYSRALDAGVRDSRDQWRQGPVVVQLVRDPYGITARQPIQVCADDDCLNWHIIDRQRGRRDAHAAGWFTSPDGTQNFCHEHLHEWVPAWRAKHNNNPTEK